MLIQNKPRVGMPLGGTHTKATVAEDNTGFIKSVASQSLRTEKSFENFAPHAPQNVKQAWNRAATQTGVNGLGIGENGMITHIPAALVLQIEQQQQTGSSDVFGNSVGSALESAKKILERLENPILPETNAKIRSYHEQEKSFYRSFIGHLEEYNNPAPTTEYIGLRL